MSARPGLVGVIGVGVGALAAVLAAQQAPGRDRTPPTAQTPQTPTTGTSSLSGTVLNDTTGRPLRRATVSVSSIDNGLWLAAVTGDDGAFGFSDLPAGRYSLGASRVGYVSATYGAKKVGRPGVAISLADGQKQADVTLRLPPGAVIAGTVRATTGEPMPGARVALLRRGVRFDTGESTFQRADGFSSGAGLAGMTDDRGEYRWYGLPPDDYYVVAVPNSGLIRDANETRETTAAELDWASRLLHEPNGAPIATPPPAPGPAVDYVPVFYPGTATAARASTVNVRAGDERDGIDIVMDLVPTARVTGTVSMPDGGPLPAVIVNVISHDVIPGLPFGGFGNARVDRDGRFASGGLVPGDYTIMVRPVLAPNGTAASPPTTALFGIDTVTVNGSDVDAPITLESGVTVSGHVAFDGTSPRPPLAGIRVNLDVKRTSLPSIGVPNAVTDATGAFRFSGVAPGSYHLTAMAASGWQLRSASGFGQEALDAFIEIGHNDITDATVTFSDRSTEVSGSLVDAAGHPAPEYTIIIFAADKTFWTPLSRRIQSTKPASDGHFRFANLPAGDYRIAAVTDVEQGEWYDPAFLTEIASASRPFTLAEGEKKVEDFKISGGHVPLTRPVGR